MTSSVQRTEIQSKELHMARWLHDWVECRAVRPGAVQSERRASFHCIFHSRLQSTSKRLFIQQIYQHIPSLMLQHFLHQTTRNLNNTNLCRDGCRLPLMFKTFKSVLSDGSFICFWPNIKVWKAELLLNSKYWVQLCNWSTLTKMILNTLLPLNQIWTIPSLFWLGDIE